MADNSKPRSTANGSDISLKPSVEEETYNKVHHDLDVAAAHRKPIVTESKYKVKVAEPGVDTLHLADHDHVEGHGDGGRVERKSEKTTVTRTSQTTTEKPKSRTTGESQKGQFIAKPDVYSEKDRRGEDDDDDDEGGFNLWPLVGGVVALAGVIGGVMFYRKKNPDVDVKIRRSVEDADNRVKGAFGSGERKVKELIGSGQEKFNHLIHRGEREAYDDDYENYDNHDQGHGRSLNPFNAFSGDSSGNYQVKQGDNMSKIARNNGKRSWQEVAEKNPSIRNPDLIYPGDRLKL